ncbi:MAG TPA: sugar-binding transcriptional regulator [Aggregatilineaceae bacterium]|nr:sugar-binding transcriptional regulator [Aggregatilineaceae bacterium]
MARLDELRLMAKVARLYYERGLRQTDIADQLDLSQATISRLLKRAQQEEIVRISVSAPLGAYTQLEDALETAFGLKEAIVVDCVSNGDLILPDIGSAAAYYLETTLKQDEVIGISSWSSALLATVDAMRPLPRPIGAQVIQILGGVGNPAAEHHAVHLVRRLAVLVQGEAVFLPAPGIAGSAKTQRVYLQDQYVRQTTAQFETVTLALVGIGSVEPSGLLATSGNVFSPQELDTLREQGAVGDICLRFYDANGTPIQTSLNDRVIGMELEQLRQRRRCVGIAGGKRKLPAIRGALKGHLINVLITDLVTAQSLLAPPSELDGDTSDDHGPLSRQSGVKPT